MTSSWRTIHPCEATLQRDGEGGDARVVGPIRLPTEDIPSFVQQFNATYVSVGLSIHAPPRHSDGTLILNPDGSPPS